MTDYDHTLAHALGRLTPEPRLRPQWERVLVDARDRVPRRLIALAVLGLAVLVPLSALAVHSEWWFLRNPAPEFQPVGGVVTVTSGTWDGTPWALTAHVTADIGVCTGMVTNPGEDDQNGAVGCGSGVYGEPGIDEAKLENGRRHVGYVSGSGNGLRAWIAGPTSRDTFEVMLVLRDGRTLRTNTIAAPAALDAPIRFYVSRLPAPDSVARVVALDRDGTVLGRMTVPHLRR